MTDENASSPHGLTFETSELEGTVTERLAVVARQIPDAPALSDGIEKPISYRELVSGSRAGSESLRSRYPHITGPVALLMPHEPLAIASELAIIGAGRAVMPLDPTYPLDYLRRAVGGAGPDLVLCSPDLEELARAVAGDVPVEVWTQLPDERAETDDPATPDDPADPTFLIFTSGSTGQPKGAVPNHRAFLGGARAFGIGGVFGPGDRVAMIAPLSFAAAAAQTMWALLNGAEVCTFPVRARGLPAFVEWMRESSITVFPTQASLVRAVASVVGNDPVPTLRLVMPGGEAIHPGDIPVLRAMGAGPVRITPVYVATETMLMAWDDIGPEVDPVDLRAVTLEQPVDGVALELEPVSLLEQSDGEIGEIVVVSQISSSGYWREPGLTAERFTFDHDSNSMRYRTGDLGRRRASGIEIVGRLDTMVKVRGARIELGAIESELLSFQPVDAAAVVTVNDGQGDRRLVAHVTSGEIGEPTSSTAVRAHLRQSLPPQMVPAHVVIHEALPRLPNGKVDRLTLETWPLAVEDTRISARTDTERRLVKHLHSLIDLDEIGVTNDLFELGIDSVGAIEVIVFVEKEFGVVLPMSSWIELTSVERIAREVDSRMADREKPAVRSVVVIQHGESGRQPLLLVNDLHGSAFRFTELARAVGVDQPCLGTDSPLLSGDRSMPASFEEIAAVHVADLELLSDGPYNLVGYSSNALLAFEIAQQLRCRGSEVGFLALIDFGPVHVRHSLRRTEGPRPPGGWPERPRSDLSRRERLAFHIERLRAASLSERLSLLSRAFDYGKPYDLAVARKDLRRRGRIRPELRGAYCWYRQMEMAIAYQPTPIDHDAVLLLSDTTAKGRMEVSHRLDYGSATDRELGWGPLVRNLEVIDVIGYHNDLVKPPYVADVGATLRAAFDRWCDASGATPS